MKTTRFLILIALCGIMFWGCQEDTMLSSSEDSASNNLSTRTEDKCPLFTGERILDLESAFESSWNGFMARNINFEAEKQLFALYSNENDTTIVRTFQNIVRIYDDSEKMIKEILVTLVPTVEYYQTHPTIDWETLSFYNNTSDFTGYEFFANPKNGNIYGAWYYVQGQKQYGTILQKDDLNFRMKQAFILKLAQKFSLIQLDNKKTRDKIEIEVYEELDMGDGIKRKVCRSYIKRIDDSAVDADGGRDYIGGSTGGRRDPTDLMQRDSISVEGNTFFTQPIITSYLLNSTFPAGGYDSSPCFAVTLALEYFSKYLTPEQIWESVDTPEYFYNIFNDNISKEDLETLISKHLRYYSTSSQGVLSAIRSGRPCITVSKTGLGNCVYKCMLIVGITIDNYYIYLDPVTGGLRCRYNDFLNDYTFVITGSK